MRKILKPVLEVLAGIPSVVYGYFALTFVAPELLDGLIGIEVGTYSVLAAGLVLGVMIIPTVASLSEDAMTAVPQSLRQGRWHSVRTGCGPRCAWSYPRRSPESPPPSCSACPAPSGRP